MDIPLFPVFFYFVKGVFAMGFSRMNGLMKNIGAKITHCRLMLICVCLSSLPLLSGCTLWELFTGE